jgi:hypothetical protein
MGSFLLLDDDANVSFLIVTSAKDKSMASSNRVKATPVPGCPDRVYAHVAKPTEFDVDHHRVVSYHAYMQELDAKELLLI